MLKLSHLSILSSLIVGMLLTASPASAMTTSEAIKACDSNPNCSMKWGKENDSITMRVKGSDKVIDCPKVEGPCVAVIKTTRPAFDARSDHPDASLASDGHGGSDGNQGGGGDSGGTGNAATGTGVSHSDASDGTGSSPIL